MFKQQHRKVGAAARHTPVSKVSLTPRGEPPHAASRFDAGTGQGTISRIPAGKTLDHPILDGSTESRVAQGFTENPFRGRRDPALGEWNYSHAHEYEDDLAHEPELRRKYDAFVLAHENDLEPRRWYKYDPFRRDRNRAKLLKRQLPKQAM